MATLGQSAGRATSTSNTLEVDAANRRSCRLFELSPELPIVTNQRAELAALPNPHPPCHVPFLARRRDARTLAPTPLFASFSSLPLFPSLVAIPGEPVQLFVLSLSPTVI